MKALKIIGLILVFAGAFVGGYLSPIGGVGVIPESILGEKTVISTPVIAPAKVTPVEETAPMPVSQEEAFVASVETLPLTINSVNVIEAGINLYDVQVVASANVGDQLQYILTTSMGEQVVSPKFGASGDVCHIAGVPASDNGLYILTVNVVGDPSRTQIKNVEGLVKTANTTPTEIKVSVAPRHKNKPKSVNRVATITINETPGEFLCIIKSVATGGEVKRQKMANGSVSISVPPVDGGQYTIVVRNIATGEEISVQKGGFDPIDKWGQTKVQAQLNSDSRDPFLRHHFNLDNFKIKCEGDDVVTSLEELLELKANGGTITVVGTPQYDKYNRITNLTVRINY